MKQQRLKDRTEIRRQFQIMNNDLRSAYKTIIARFDRLEQAGKVQDIKEEIKQSQATSNMIVTTA